jgi:UDP-glucuronate decarboxylase
MDDLLEGMMRLMNHDSLTGPLNIGNPGEFTILELAQKVIEKTGSKSEIIHKDLPIDDPLQRKPDITLAKNELDWEPKINLDQGLEKTIAYFRTLLDR